ncbi:MAG: MerR family transcriptional regulator [Gemmatimonadaceae bacterium]|nr:MerR family transcriptional regulator [Gemmatimonadaceae bacterium]
MSPDCYDLLELCDLADVTPRTVRYYIQQGLLPSPDSKGRGSRYDRTHLERIQLIKRLQGKHLPLAEIRTQLAELSDASVAALVAQPAFPEKSGSALAYVQEVLANSKTRLSLGGNASSPQAVPPAPSPRSASTPAAAPPPSPPSASHRESVTVPPPVAPEEIAATTSLPSQPRSTWERIPLTPDIEVHVRRPLSRLHNKLLDRLLEQARNLLSDQT